MTRTLTGWHVLTLFGLGFSIIISVNLTLAYNAIATFPGIEVKNSYVASQSFDRDRAAQNALGWDVAATLHGDTLRLTIADAAGPVRPKSAEAVFGRATSVAADQTPVFAYDGTAFVAPVVAGPGNWNLRLQAVAADGTLFKQRIVVAVLP